MESSKISITGNDINITRGASTSIEINHVFKFIESQPYIKVYENGDLRKTYLIETLAQNADLTDQYLHSSIRLLNNDAVMIDGIISKSGYSHSSWKDADFEAVRLQPFFLLTKEEENQKLIGKGLFNRGLQFSGTVTPSGVRLIGICDNCSKSFSMQTFHAGFLEAQYFYSSDSKQTLIVMLNQIENMPVQLQKNIDSSVLEIIESQLPKPTKGSGFYKYYNSFRCPHCNAPYVDFEKNKEFRPLEYYGIYLLNDTLQRIV